MTICRPFERDAIYRQDLLSFSWKAFEILNPGARWLNNWRIEMITDRLTAVVEGRCNRLIINLPPRSLKSLPRIGCSTSLPARERPHQ